MPSGKYPSCWCTSGTSAAGIDVGSALYPILPVAASNAASTPFCSAHGARYSHRNPSWRLSLSVACQLSSMNGAIVGELYVAPDAPNAPAHVEQ